MVGQPVIDYPVQPRLSPDGTKYICDQCGRMWALGATSDCPPCMKAVDEKANQKMSKPNPKRGIRIHRTGEPGVGAGTSVTFLDGEEIPGVISVEIMPITAVSMVTAKIEMKVHELDVVAFPFLGLGAIKMAAEAQGYELVKKDKE